MKNAKEFERLSFVMRRDGMDGAVDFAKRAYKAYRSTLLMTKKIKRGIVRPTVPTLRVTPENRPDFIQSCLSFREFLRVWDKKM